MTKTKIVAIVGPTAAGKSKIGLLLALKIGAEIISADSMQVYREMDIGTAKPTSKERKKVSHHLIDLISPDKNFSVSEYQRLAREAVEKISQRGKIPLLVGGSGLYVRAVLDDLDFPSGALNSSLRKIIERRAEKEGKEVLFEELKRIDPEAAQNIHPQNVRRVIRALEVIQLTGKKFSDYQKRWKLRIPFYPAKVFGISLPRDILYQKINERVEKMIENGFLEEVRYLKRKYQLALTARQALGYRELFNFLEDKCTLSEAIEEIKKKTRNFAKRQLSWFKNDKRVIWLDAYEKSKEELVEEIIKKLKSWL